MSIQTSARYGHEPNDSYVRYHTFIAVDREDPNLWAVATYRVDNDIRTMEVRTGIATRERAEQVEQEQAERWHPCSAYRAPFRIQQSA